MLAAEVSGLQYMFGLLSPTLKDTFTLSQEQLDSIASAANFGGNFGIHLGYLNDVYGPRLVGGLACAMSSCSWFLMWAAVHYRWLVSWQFLSLVSFVQGNGQVAMDLAMVPTVSSSFPDHRGMAIGISKAFIGRLVLKVT